MKKLIFLLISIIIVATFVITCPDKEKHCEAIKTAFAEKLSEDMNNKSEDKLTEFEKFCNMLGDILTSGIVDLYLNTNMKVKNYFVLSIGEIYYDGKPRKISIGFLNHVFVPELSDEDIQKMK